MSDTSTMPDLGQCVFEMSTGKRCPKAAATVIYCGGGRTGYGYCTNHMLSATQIRPHKRHRTAEPLSADVIEAREYVLHAKHVDYLRAHQFSDADISDDDLWVLGSQRVMDGLKALHAYGVTEPERIARMIHLVGEGK